MTTPLAGRSHKPCCTDWTAPTTDRSNVRLTQAALATLSASLVSLPASTPTSISSHSSTYIITYKVESPASVSVASASTPTSLNATTLSPAITDSSSTRMITYTVRSPASVSIASTSTTFSIHPLFSSPGSISSSGSTFPSISTTALSPTEPSPLTPDP